MKLPLTMEDFDLTPEEREILVTGSQRAFPTEPEDAEILPVDATSEPAKS